MTIRLRLLALTALLSAVQTGLAQSSMVPVVTRAYDNNRTGWNQNETVLTQASVKAKGIRRVTTIPVFGDARGMEAQPLILPNVHLPDGSTRDVMVMPSMANRVRGVDAHTGEALWDINLGTPIIGNTPIGPRKPKPDGCVGDFPTIDCHNVNDKWGVLSTGVIDPDTQRVYLVAWVSPDGTPQKANHFVNVLKVADGSQVVKPVLVAGVSGVQSYSSTMRKQRSSLVLTNVNGRKTVFWASGTVLETGQGAAGWIFAFDCATNSITAALALSQGKGAGVWMGGQGLSADNQGFLYAVTGNGSFDGIQDFGESVVKIQYKPPDGESASLKVVSWWSPYTDAARTGRKPANSDETEFTLAQSRMAGMSALSEALKPVGSGMAVSLQHARVVKSTNNLGKPVQLVFPRLANNAAWNDEDLGSAGGALIEKSGIYIATGKDGIAYPTRIANMGNTKPADFANPQTNCAKLAAPPVWLTESPGLVDPCPLDLTTLDFLPWGKTRHLHMTPVQYVTAIHGQMIFAWGENSQLHAWAVSPSGKLTYLAQSNEFASANVTNAPGGMPGGFCTLSSNRNTTGSAVLWCTVPYGDANATITNGRLLAYDPENFVTNADGSKTLAVLWDSQQWNISFKFNKFDPPVVDGGQVYVPNYDGGVDVYQLVQ